MGPNTLNPSPIICSRTLFTEDVNGKSTAIHIDLTANDSSRRIGLVFRRLSSRNFQRTYPTTTFWLLLDSQPRTFNICIHGGYPLRIHAYHDTTGLRFTTSAIIRTKLALEPRTTTLAKDLHRYSRAPWQQKVELISRNSISKRNLVKICR